MQLTERQQLRIKSIRIRVDNFNHWIYRTSIHRRDVRDHVTRLGHSIACCVTTMDKQDPYILAGVIAWMEGVDEDLEVEICLKG